MQTTTIGTAERRQMLGRPRHVYNATWAAMGDGGKGAEGVSGGSVYECLLCGANKSVWSGTGVSGVSTLDVTYTTTTTTTATKTATQQQRQQK